MRNIGPRTRTPHVRRQIKPALAATVLGVAIVALSACGSSANGTGAASVDTSQAAQSGANGSSTPSTSSPTASADTSSAGTSSDATQSQSSIGSDVGTITLSGSGTTVTEQLSLTPIAYGTSAAPSTDVLNSYANSNYLQPEIIARSGYVHGQMTLSYTRGTLPVMLSYSKPWSALSNELSQYDANAPITVDTSNNGWVSGAGGGGIQLPLQPGQVATYEFWIDLPEAISNSQLTIPPKTQDQMSWQFVPTVDQIQNPRIALSGPQAAVCSGNTYPGPYLVPFAHLPFTITVQSYSTTSTVTCRKK